MKRPNAALTGIDQKLSAKVTWDLSTAEYARLSAVRNGHGASWILNGAIVVAVGLFAVGVQLPDNMWVPLGAVGLVIAALGFVAFRMLRERGTQAQDHLSTIVKRDYNARLLLVREHDVIVEAGYPAGRGYA